MKTLVADYSLRGSTRKVAEQIAQDLSADMEEIKCSKPCEGLLAFFNPAYDNWRGHLPTIALTRHSLEKT